MSRMIDREGIFKARPLSWEIYRAESGAVAVSMNFEITAELNESSDWDDWTQYEQHTCYGNWWVVKRDKSINMNPVKQLAESLGWDGNLSSVSPDNPPDQIVQITVRENVYQDNLRYRADWMNPGDFTPSPRSASPEDVQQLETQFGSLLRAAASAVQPTPPPPPSPPAPMPTDEPSTDDGAPAPSPPVVAPDDDLPF